MAIIEENLANFLEPNPEMDIKVKIVGVALFHALMKDGIPEVVRLSLLKYWLHLVNITNEDVDDFVAYFPICPEVYFKFAELEYSNPVNDHLIHNLLLYTFAKWGREPKFQEHFRRRFEKWLGYINIYGYIEARGAIEQTDKDKERTKNILGLKIDRLGPIKFMGFDFILTETWSEIELSRLALQTISHLDQQCFLQAIVKGVITEAVMGYPRNGPLFKWIIRINSSAFDFKLKEEYEKDPCNSIFQWKKEHYYNCLEKTDVDLYRIARNIKEYALEPDSG
jgi:hypothetical protein